MSRALPFPLPGVKDTLKKVASKALWISDTPARSSFWAAQTPQCYRRGGPGRSADALSNGFGSYG